MRTFVYLGPIRFGAESRDAVTRRLRGGLHRFEERVERASLFVTDVNGAKGGPDLRCVCIVRLRGNNPIVIRDVGSHLTPLVERVVDRALRVVSEASGARRRRAVERRREEFAA